MTLFLVIQELVSPSLFYFTSVLFGGRPRAYVRPMIYGTDLIHRLRGVTHLHAVAHANTINHGEYELGTRTGCHSKQVERPGQTFAVSLGRRVALVFSPDR